MTTNKYKCHDISLPIGVTHCSLLIDDVNYYLYVIGGSKKENNFWRIQLWKIFPGIPLVIDYYGRTLITNTRNIWHKDLTKIVCMYF